MQLKIFGFPLEPWDFVSKAIQHPHPFSVESCLPEVLQNAIVANVTLDAAVIAEQRCAFIKKWTARAIALKDDENLVRQSMDAIVDKCTKQKRILLFSEMLSDLDYPDMGVIDELRSGSDLIGDIPVTGMLPGKLSIATQTASGLASRSKLMQKKLVHSMVSSGDESVDCAVWDKTMEEVEQGWLSGPFSLEDIGEEEPISRRFGLKQRDKVRPIDDFSASGVNDAVTSWESPMLHTVDVIGSIVTAWFESAQRFAKKSDLLTRTFDLTSAYRQVALSEEGRRHSLICVFDPRSRRGKLFRCNVLPFGAVRSVHSFLRLARAIWFVAVKGCNIVWSSFYDDYITVTTEELAVNTEQCIVSLFKLTGWAFAESGKKCHPFDCSCEALGVVINLQKSADGEACISNTRSRVDELVNVLRSLSTEKPITRVDAQRLRGRMQFAEAQLFGRVGKRCIRALSSVADGFANGLNQRDIQFIYIFCDMIESGPPRKLTARSADCFHIFTDACYERDAVSWPCGVGGVLVCAEGPIAFFSLELHADVRVLLGEQHKKQIIFECETLAAVIAFILWSKVFEAKRSILYVDNEGSKFALIKGFADNEVVDKLAYLFATVETGIHSFLWIARVASYSNIADKPSRGDTTELRSKLSKDETNEARVVLDSILQRSLI